MRGWARWVDPQPKTVSTGEWTAPFSIGDKVSDLFLFLRSGTVTPAQIDLIQLQLNGVTVWTLTGARLDAINQYFGFPAFSGIAGGRLRIPFGLPDMLDSPLRDMTAINTGSVGPGGAIISSGQLTVQLTGAALATFEVYARVSDQLKGGPGVIRRYTTFTDTNTVDLTPITSRLPHGHPQSSAWSRIYYSTSVGTILETMILADGKRVDGLTPIEITNGLQVDEGLDPTGGGLFDGTWTTSAEGIGVAPIKTANGITPGNLPYFNTIPFKDKAVQVYIKNSSGAGVNTVILETISEFKQ